MNYKKVIADYNNGTINYDNYILVIDNDGGYWVCIDPNISEEEQDKCSQKMAKKYGNPQGYGDKPLPKKFMYMLIKLLLSLFFILKKLIFLKT